jgi:Domain of unknown function (DUF1648)
MNRKAFQISTWLMWLALPLTAFRFWLVWDRLPLRMATHFNVNGQPNGWMPRESAFYTALGITAGMVAVFTAVSYVAHKTHAPDAFSWSLLGFFYLVTGFVNAANSGVVQYNLDGQPMQIDFWTVLIPVATLALIASFLGTKRGASLPVAGVIAGRVARLASLEPAVHRLAHGAVFRCHGTTGPASSPRIGAFVSALRADRRPCVERVSLLFTSSGVEISTLGFRLRSIPRDEIKQYEVESWNSLRGYGIRGIGNRRAYVWCNRGVRIKTTEGEVFLGHNEPERIVHDLDLITH